MFGIRKFFRDIEIRKMPARKQGLDVIKGEMLETIGIVERLQNKEPDFSYPVYENDYTIPFNRIWLYSDLANVIHTVAKGRNLQKRMTNATDYLLAQVSASEHVVPREEYVVICKANRYAQNRDQADQWRKYPRAFPQGELMVLGDEMAPLMTKEQLAKPVQSEDGNYYTSAYVSKKMGFMFARRTAEGVDYRIKLEKMSLLGDGTQWHQNRIELETRLGKISDRDHKKTVENFIAETDKVFALPHLPSLPCLTEGSPHAPQVQ